MKEKSSFREAVRRGSAGRRGYSILELTAALSIFSLSLIGFFSLTNVKVRNLSYADAEARAVHAAENKISELRGADWKALGDANGRTFPVAGLDLAGKDPGRVRVENGPEEGVRLAVVTVEWEVGRGATRSLSLETWIRNRE